MDKNNIIDSQKGVSLIELVVVTGVLALIAGCIAMLMIQQVKNNVKVHEGFEINELMILIGDTLKNSSSCSETLGGMAIPLDLTAPISVKIIKSKGLDGSGLPVEVFNIDKYKNMPTMRVDKMELTNREPFDGQRLFRYSLEITFLSGSLANPTPTNPIQTITRRIPIIVRGNNTDPKLLPTKIESCYVDQAVWLKELCEGMLQGFYDEKLPNSVPAKYVCSNINVPGSVSTDGSFCFNDPAVGDPRKATKDCVSSWFMSVGSCYTTSFNCQAREVLAGVRLIQTGKYTYSNENTCCVARIK